MLRRVLIAAAIAIVALTVLGLLADDDDEDGKQDPVTTASEPADSSAPPGFALLERPAAAGDELPEEVAPTLPETGGTVIPVNAGTARRSGGSRDGIEVWAAGDEETVCLLVGGDSAGQVCLPFEEALARGILQGRGADDDPPATVDAGEAVYVALVPDGVSSVVFELNGQPQRTPVDDNVAVLVAEAGRVVLSWQGPDGPAERSTTATF